MSAIAHRFLSFSLALVFSVASQYLAHSRPLSQTPCVSGVSQRIAREDKCIKATSNGLSALIDQAFLAEYLSPEVARDGWAMLRKLKQSFIQVVLCGHKCAHLLVCARTHTHSYEGIFVGTHEDVSFVFACARVREREQYRIWRASRGWIMQLTPLRLARHTRCACTSAARPNIRFSHTYVRTRIVRILTYTQTHTSQRYKMCILDCVKCVAFTPRIPEFEWYSHGARTHQNRMGVFLHTSIQMMPYDVSRTSYFDNSAQAYHVKMLRMFVNLGQQLPEERWTKRAFTVNAWSPSRPPNPNQFTLTRLSKLSIKPVVLVAMLFFKTLQFPCVLQNSHALRQTTECSPCFA